jgi:mRNA-degrading endonuclease toxin of MazEF toxin-antitoxin module
MFVRLIGCAGFKYYNRRNSINMKRGDIYFLNEQGSGSVQTGKRPVIVVQNDIGNTYSPTTIVCSITSAKKPKIPTHLFIGKQGGLIKPSTILCEQIKTVDKTALEDYIGSITDQRTLQKLNTRILISLGVISNG